MTPSWVDSTADFYLIKFPGFLQHLLHLLCHGTLFQICKYLLFQNRIHIFNKFYTIFHLLFIFFLA